MVSRLNHLRIEGLKCYRSRGVPYYYHRASGRRVLAPYGSAEFFAELEAINRHWQEHQPPQPVPGTLGALVADYRRAPRWTDLAVRTRADYEKVLHYLAPIMDTALLDFTRPAMARLRDKVASDRNWRFANYCLNVLSAVFSHGVEYGYMHVNPCHGVRRVLRPRDLPDANRPWSSAERAAVMDAAPPHIRRVLTVLMFTGLRISDALALSPRAVCSDGWLRHRTAKTGALAEIPIHPQLAAILAQCPSHGPRLLLTSRGRPWSYHGFRTAFRRLRCSLEASGSIQPGLTLHGVRHTVGTLLAEAGVSREVIASWLTHSDISTTAHYVKSARSMDAKKSASEAFSPLSGPHKSLIF